MQFDRNSKPWQACSTEAGRYPGMTHARLCEIREGTQKQGEEAPPRLGTLVSCNGRILAVQTVNVDTSDEEGYVDVEALKRAHKVKAPRYSSVGATLSCNGEHATTDGVKSPRPSVEEEKPGDCYPRFRAVMPRLDDKSRIRVGLNPRLLWELAQALGWKDEPGTSAVMLSIHPTDRNAPIGVSTLADKPEEGIERRGVLCTITIDA